MTAEYKLLQQALDALVYHMEQTRPIQKTMAAIAALDEALAQPQAEPVAWRWRERPHESWGDWRHVGHCPQGSSTATFQSEPLYTHSAAPAPAVPERTFTTGHCKERQKDGGCQLHNLHCGYPACDQRATSPQPAPPPVALTLEYIDAHIGPDEGDRAAVIEIVRQGEAAHGITAKEAP